MGIIDRFKKSVHDITGKTVEAQVADYSEVYGEVLLGLDHELETVNGKIVRLQEAATRGEAAQRETAGRLSRLEEAEAARQHEMNALQERFAQAAGTVHALQQSWAEHDSRLKEQLRLQRGAMRRLILWAAAAGAAAAGCIEAVMLWIRG